MFPNGWEHYLAGGLLLGLGMSLLFVATGRIGGMSTVFTTVWSFFSRAPYFRQPRFVELSAGPYASASRTFKLGKRRDACIKF